MKPFKLKRKTNGAILGEFATLKEAQSALSFYVSKKGKHDVMIVNDSITKQELEAVWKDVARANWLRAHGMFRQMRRNAAIKAAMRAYAAEYRAERLRLSMLENEMPFEEDLKIVKSSSHKTAQEAAKAKVSVLSRRDVKAAIQRFNSCKQQTWSEISWK